MDNQHMDNLEELLTALPKNKISRTADLKIRFKLYRLIIQNRLNNFFDLFVWQLTPLKKIWALALVILLLFGTTSVYAYASSDVVPGSQLYPLKIAIEKIEQKITVDNSAKIVNLEKFSTRRLEEAVNLSEKNQKTNRVVAANVATNNENIKNNIAAEVSNHEAVVRHINNLSDSQETEAIISEAKKNDQKEIKYLDRIAEYAQSNNDIEVLQRINDAKEKISHQEYRSKKNKNIDSTEITSGELEIETASTSISRSTSTKQIKNYKNWKHQKNIIENKQTGTLEPTIITETPERATTTLELAPEGDTKTINEKDREELHRQEDNKSR